LEGMAFQIAASASLPCTRPSHGRVRATRPSNRSQRGPLYVLDEKGTDSSPINKYLLSPAPISPVIPCSPVAAFWRRIMTKMFVSPLSVETAILCKYLPSVSGYFYCRFQVLCCDYGFRSKDRMYGDEFGKIPTPLWELVCIFRGPITANVLCLSPGRPKLQPRTERITQILSARSLRRHILPESSKNSASKG